MNYKNTGKTQNHGQASLHKLHYAKIFLSLLLISFVARPFLLENAFAATNPAGISISGMTASDNDPVLENYGTISGGILIESIDSQSGQKMITYAGMLGRNTGSANYLFSNYGTILINNSLADSIAGMLADANASGSHGLNNSGTITVSGNYNVTGMSATTATTGSETLYNSGTITASGKNSIFGMFSTANGGNNSLINTKNITISGVGNLAAMNAIGNGNHSLNNSGTLSVNGSGAELYGMNAKGEGNHTLVNSGTITVTGGGSDNLYGMSAEGIGFHSLTNSRSITVESQARNVHGIHLQSSLENVQDSHEIVNTGTLSVSGLSSIYGIYGEVKSGTLNVNNSGTITANGSDLVFGMYVAQVQGGNASHSVSNTGSISAKATNGKAYEVYGTTNYNVDTFATNLRNWTLNDTVFGVIDTQAVNFNNATFIVRPGTDAQGFALGKSYNVSDMLAVVNAGSTADPATSANVTGNISKVTTDVPFLKATLTSGHDPLNASIRLDSNVNEESTPGAASQQQATETVKTQFNTLSANLRKSLFDVYADTNFVAQNSVESNTDGVAAGSGSTQAGRWNVFVTPYLSNVNNSALNYDGNSHGITAGASYRLSENFSFGGHLSFGVSDFSADLMSMDADSTSFALGLHAAYNFTPEWYLRGQVTASLQENDNHYSMATLQADSDFSGQALYAALATGYIWQIADNHSLSPEIELAYLGTQTDAYDIEWSDPLYNLHYDDNNYNAFYTNVNLDWRSKWDFENHSISFLAGLGLRQKLGNNDSETDLRALGSSYTNRYTEDSTSVLASAGIEFTKDNFSVSLDYNGEYGSDQKVHTGSLNFSFRF